LFCVRIFSFFSLFLALWQKAFSVYPTRQNIFIPDISQLANHDDEVSCCYGDSVLEKEGTTNVHTHSCKNKAKGRMEVERDGDEARVGKKDPTIQQ
jgi:hypothetical protein